MVDEIFSKDVYPQSTVCCFCKLLIYFSLCSVLFVLDIGKSINDLWTFMQKSAEKMSKIKNNVLGLFEFSCLKFI